MHRPTFRLTALPVAALFVTSLLLACNNDQFTAPDSPTATATARPTATPSSTPRRTPTPITSTASPTPTPIVSASPVPRLLVAEPASPGLASVLTSGDPLVVVSGEIASPSRDHRSWPVIAVVTLNQSGRELLRAEFGEIGRHPTRWGLAGDELIVGLETAILRLRLDGTIAAVLVPESDRRLGNVLISPNGSRIAFTEFGDPDCGEACIVIVDVQTGATLARIPHSGTPLEDLRRYAQPSHWRSNEALLVRGQPNGHAFTGIGTVTVNGSVTIHDVPPSGTVSVSGRHLLRWVGAVEGYQNDPLTCGFRPGFEVRDIDTGALLGSSLDPEAALANTFWSPDDREVLVARRILPDPEEVPCDGAYWVWFQGTLLWSLFDTASGDEHPIDDPLAVWQRWYGQPYAELACPQGRVQFLGSGNKPRIECIDADRQQLTQTSVLLDGAPIATGPYDRVLGVLPPSTRLTSEELHALPPDARFGEPATDAIIDALLTADVDAIVNAIQWEQSACATNWTGGFPGPAPCTASEVNGTLVDTLFLSGNEGRYARPDAIHTLLEQELPRSRVLCELQTHDDGKRVIRLRLATVYRGQPTTAVTDDLTFTIIDGRIVSTGNLVDPGHRDSVHCAGLRDLTLN